MRIIEWLRTRLMSPLGISHYARNFIQYGQLFANQLFGPRRIPVAKTGTSDVDGCRVSLRAILADGMRRDPTAEPGWHRAF